MTETNVFGDRICDKDCPAWNGEHENDAYGCFCEAKLDFTCRTSLKDGKVQYGMLCKLPVDFKVVRNEA